MNQLDPFQRACAETEMEKLINGKWFDICSLDNLGKMLGINPERHPNYKFLRGLHCVHYADMKPDVRNNIVPAIMECLRPDMNYDAKQILGAITAEGRNFTPIEDKPLGIQ